MLKLLVKKQIAEVFRGYFYDSKKNRMRSKGAIAAFIVMFILIMVVFLGGMFTSLAYSLCGPLTKAGVGWMYFLLMSGLALLFGLFGSVFNSYTALYLSRDNDLLLSLPIPVRTIMAARLTNVYLLGAMYSAVIMIPTMVVYWIVSGATAARVICGILMFLILTGIILALACLLGWVVAKISLKLKSKSIITVLITLLCIGAYYLIFFRFSDILREVQLHAQVYGEKIRSTAFPAYLFGRIGEGDWLAAVVFLAITAILFALVWKVMSRSFLKIATAGAKTETARYVEKRAKEKTPFMALLGKEIGRFTSSASYMLNCGLGILLIPAGGVAMLIKGKAISEGLGEALASRPDSAAILLCASLCMMAAMNDMAVPAVSLEGKSLWIPRSLPVESKWVLRAKASMQLIFTAIPMLFACICVALILPASLPVKLLSIGMPLAYTVFSALFGTAIGVRMPLLDWTNEMAPVKQSGGVAIALFGGWGISTVFGVLYLVIGYKMGAVPYLLLWTILFAAAAGILLRWLDTKGSAGFAAL